MIRLDYYEPPPLDSWAEDASDRRLLGDVRQFDRFLVVGNELREFADAHAAKEAAFVIALRRVQIADARDAVDEALAPFGDLLRANDDREGT